MPAHLYTDDYNDWIVPAFTDYGDLYTKFWMAKLSGLNGINSNYGVKYPLEKYSGSSQERPVHKGTFICNVGGTKLTGDKNTGFGYTMYTINWLLAGSPQNPANLDSLWRRAFAHKISACYNPVEVLFVADNTKVEGAYAEYPKNLSFRHGSPDPRISVDYINLPVTPTGKSQMVFIDGHASPMTYYEFSSRRLPASRYSRYIPFSASPFEPFLKGFNFDSGKLYSN